MVVEHCEAPGHHAWAIADTLKIHRTILNLDTQDAHVQTQQLCPTATTTSTPAARKLWNRRVAGYSEREVGRHAMVLCGRAYCVVSHGRGAIVELHRKRITQGLLVDTSFSTILARAAGQSETAAIEGALEGRAAGRGHEQRR